VKTEASELALSIAHDVAEMNVKIQGRDIAITEALKTHVLRRLAFALSRFGEKIVSVLVRFSNVKNRQGTVEKRCQIDVGLRRGVTGAGRDADVLVAVDRAADRAGRSVDRALACERETEDGPRRPPSKRN
jgi:ribosomal subunit interface protein